jgi:hypothetical protein
MSSRPANVVIMLAVVLGALEARELLGQSQGSQTEARLVAFTVDPQTPEFGEVFDLQLTIRIAPGVVAFLPDTLVSATASVSAGLGEWSEIAGPGDSVDVRASYPVMGFLNGRVDLPSLELWIRRVTDPEMSGLRPASDLGDALLDSAEGVQRTLIPVGAVQIAPLREMAEAGDALFPRPPADVLGGQWSIWLLSAIGVTIIASTVLAWFLFLRWKPAKSATKGHVQVRSPRDEALHELDRIRELGWHTEGRFVEFYEGSTAVLRGFSAQYEQEWGIALTSNELLAKLRERWGPSSVEVLASAVSIAEWVKFGRYRPEIDVAEGHWMMIRDWIMGIPEG